MQYFKTIFLEIIRRANKAGVYILVALNLMEKVNIFVNKYFLIDCSFIVKCNTFENNTAQISGGAIYYNAVKPEGLLENVFIQNLAGYGPNFGSFPTQLKIIESDMDWSK